MKTINRKAIVSILGSFISVAAMAQVNLGLSSTTQAALNIATSTATISQVTGKLVNTVSARANDLQAVDANGLTNSTKENAGKILPATRQQVKTTVAQTKELKNNIQDDLQSNTPAATVTGNASSGTQVSANKK